MNILLPKTLAEPGIIPWEEMGRDVSFHDIIAMIERYLNLLSKQGWFTVDSHTFADNKLVETIIQRMVSRKGGFSVRTISGILVESTTKEYVATVFHVWFRTRKDGPERDRIFYPNRAYE